MRHQSSAGRKTIFVLFSLSDLVKPANPMAIFGDMYIHSSVNRNNPAHTPLRSINRLMLCSRAYRCQPISASLVHLRWENAPAPHKCTLTFTYPREENSCVSHPRFYCIWKVSLRISLFCMFCSRKKNTRTKPIAHQSPRGNCKTRIFLHIFTAYQHRNTRRGIPG